MYEIRAAENDWFNVLKFGTIVGCFPNLNLANDYVKLMTEKLNIPKVMMFGKLNYTFDKVISDNLLRYWRPLHHNDEIVGNMFVVITYDDLNKMGK